MMKMTEYRKRKTSPNVTCRRRTGHPRSTFTLLETNPKMTEGYKTDKEAFVSGMTGSSITHINLVSLVALVRPPNTSRIHIIA